MAGPVAVPCWEVFFEETGRGSLYVIGIWNIVNTYLPIGRICIGQNSRKVAS